MSNNRTIVVLCLSSNSCTFVILSLNETSTSSGESRNFFKQDALRNNRTIRFINLRSNDGSPRRSINTSSNSP